MSGKHSTELTPRCFGELERDGQKFKLGYSGTVTMLIPTLSQKRAILEGFGVTTAAEVTAAMENAGESYRKMTAHLVTKVSSFVKSIDIKRDEDGCKITDWEDVEYEGPLAAPLTSELAWWVINGKHRLPGPSSPS